MKVLSPQNLYAMKHVTFQFSGPWGELLGNPPKNGAWIIFGKDKHGKTSFTLSLIKYLSEFEKVLYVSAEEGTDPLFIDSVKRSKINSSNRVGFLPYISIENPNEKLSNRKAHKVIVLDNMTIYSDEFKGNGITEFMKKNADKLIVFLSHEDRKEPSLASGRLVKKLAKIVVRVEGLTATIGGRCPGGMVTINKRLKSTNRTQSSSFNK
jgi:predicted ATP-dependent serine protease